MYCMHINRSLSLSERPSVWLCGSFIQSILCLKGLKEANTREKNTYAYHDKNLDSSIIVRGCLVAFNYCQPDVAGSLSLSGAGEKEEKDKRRCSKHNSHWLKHRNTRKPANTFWPADRQQKPEPMPSKSKDWGHEQALKNKKQATSSSAGQNQFKLIVIWIAMRGLKCICQRLKAHQQSGLSKTATNFQIVWFRCTYFDIFNKPAESDNYKRTCSCPFGLCQ